MNMWIARRIGPGRVFIGTSGWVGWTPCGLGLQRLIRILRLENDGRLDRWWAIAHPTDCMTYSVIFVPHSGQVLDSFFVRLYPHFWQCPTSQGRTRKNMYATYPIITPGTDHNAALQKPTHSTSQNPPQSLSGSPPMNVHGATRIETIMPGAQICSSVDEYGSPLARA